jgi:hypothetical protein
MMTPDIGEQYFHEVAALTGAGGPPDRTKLMEVMARYGLVPVAQNPAAGPSGANQVPEYYGGVDPSPASTDAPTNEQTSTH